MTPRILTLLALSLALQSCDDFAKLGEAAECRNGLPSCPVTDAGAVDAGAIDAGGVDAGAVDAGAVDAGAVDAGAVDAGAVDAGAIDAGAVDAGLPVLSVTLRSAWSATEGGLVAGARPFRSGLAPMDGGLVLWLVSTVNSADIVDGFPRVYLSGYAVAIASSTGLWLDQDGGRTARTTTTALSYLASYVTPPNVTRRRATIGKAEILVDGGLPTYSDGGTVFADGGPLTFSNQKSTAYFMLDTPQVSGTLIDQGLSSAPLASGPLMTDAGLGHAYVSQGAQAAAETQLVLTAPFSRTYPGFTCRAFPIDIVTTYEAGVNGGVDRLLTLSSCGLNTYVLSYSAQVAGVELDLGPVATARMSIAAEGTPGRAPFVAVADATSLRVQRLNTAGTAMSAQAKLIDGGGLRVESLAVDERNRPVVVLSAARDVTFLPAGPTIRSNSGLLFVGLNEDLSVRWVGPLFVADGENLRSSAAAFSGDHLVVAVECQTPGGSASLCDANRSPVLIRVGVSPQNDLP